MEKIAAGTGNGQKIQRNRVGGLPTTAAWIEGMELESYDTLIRQSEGWLFFNIKDKSEDSDEHGYFWGRIKRDGNTILLWDPDVEKFRSLVREGVLPGEVKKSGDNKEKDSDVILGELSAEHIRVLTSGEHGVLFNWDKPLVLIKLSE